MTRGRRKDMSIPPSRALLQQRDYRARKAQHVADLEERCRRLDTENNELRKEVEDLKRRLTQVPVGPSGVNPELARASSDLMQQLTAAASSLARFQQAAALNPTDLSAPSTSRAPSSSPTPLPPASTLFHLSPLPGISPPHLRQAQSYSPPSIGSTPPKFPTLPLPRPQHFSPLHQHSPLNARQGPGDYQPCTPPVNQAALPTGRRYTDPPPPAHFHPSQHQSPRQSHHDRAPPLQSRTHVTPPHSSIPKLTPSRWEELRDPECCAGYFDCEGVAEDSDHDRSDDDEDDDMGAPASSISATSSGSRRSQVTPPTSDVRSMKD
ncbi:hypothetical protein NLI96_g10085 [Meripilus lineatus]|uniref:BZIP domain-containing protein n=1 Tax=Meripilus lineatus TaxID=2056292 RepID=A0AAD5UYT1_9APHY|nr:hypothetical protein NLI96_g10085 [Physisporinus lineatus]